MQVRLWRILCGLHSVGIQLKLCVIAVLRQALKQHVEQHPVHREEECQTDQHFECVIHHGDLNPVVGHKFITAFVEGDKEKCQGVTDIAKEHRRGRSHPPAALLAQTVEYVHVENLPQHVSHKAGHCDAGNHDIQAAERGKSLPFGFKVQRGNDIGDKQCWHH